MSEVDLAYAAGFFDGEGTIGIAAPGPQTNVGAISVSHRLVCSISSADLEPLRWLRGLFGGTVYAVKRRPDHRHRHHKWQLSAHASKAFLSSVLPYLRIKREQARLAIEFMETKDASRHPLSQEEITKREFYRQAIRRLTMGPHSERAITNGINS